MSNKNGEKVKEFFEKRKKLLLLKGALAVTAAGILLSGCKTTLPAQTGDIAPARAEQNLINARPNVFKPVEIASHLKSDRANVENAVNKEYFAPNEQAGTITYKRLVLTATTKTGELKTFAGGFNSHENWSENQTFTLNKNDFLHSLQQAAKGDYPSISYTIELPSGKVVTGIVSKDGMTGGFASTSTKQNSRPQPFAAKYTSATYSATIRDPKSHRVYTTTKAIPQKYFDQLSAKEMEEVIAEQLVCFREEVKSLSSIPPKEITLTTTLTCNGTEYSSTHEYPYYVQEISSHFENSSTCAYEELPTASK